MSTKKPVSEDQLDPHTIPTPTEEGEGGDSISIADSVIASIVRMSSLEVDGVSSVGGGSEGFWENISGKKPGRGVLVTIDEAENYVIEVHVEMRFGVELAKTAIQVQQNVRDQVSRMTMKDVSKVDVIIDGVRMDADKVDEDKEESWEQPHSD
ncbi:Asp23/Gls24 family envelope stress response protein [Rubellicoccus peritrichatus]|uniref:Asp23/Gls24 family envelope stress response protein n=1 Tax=Rubellicoccus peritrichatus TaxID=3080537 RepID=A0AAQ3LAX5_9BACT|nr:Asp23/Gls24 family envelope stress response protein [Puniceicoccus sp. CR14]WOO41907.1 Asp23/Gls24 family envelope stress response protein [Puniceicoccus sp. CR14]